MALAELSFADHAKLAKAGRNFNCENCSERVRSLRRCREDRFDFTENDNPIFPIVIEKGGTPYNFCPGKATWDFEAVSLYRLLLVSSQTGMMLDKGPLIEQSALWIDLLAWFIPFYDQAKFVARAKMILGEKG